MNTIRINLTLLLLSSLFLASCQKDDDSSVKINIEEEFNVQFFEELIPGENKLLIQISTKENLACSNVNLQHSVSNNSGSIIFSIDELELEGSCDDIPAIARKTAHLGLVEKREYDMEINLALNSIANVGSMVVTSESYQIELETTHGITLIKDQLFRIPDDCFFGYIQILDNDYADLFNDFLSILDSNSITTTLREGHYGHFDLSNGNATLNEAARGEEIPEDAQSFIYKLDGDKMELLDAVRAFQNTHSNKLKVVLYMGSGEVLL